VSVAFAPAGATLATGAQNGRVQLWDAARRSRLGAPLIGHAGSVRSLAFSPDGGRLASASDDGTTRVWQLSGAVELGARLGRHAGVGRAVAFASDGRTLASGGGDGVVELWDLAGRRPPATLGPFTAGDRTASLVGLGFRSGDRVPVSLDDDGVLRAGAQPRKRFGPAWTAAFSRDGHRIALTGWPSGAAHGPGSDLPNASWFVRVRDTEHGRPVAGPLRSERGVRAIAVSGDGRLLAIAGNTPGVKLWDLRGGAPTAVAVETTADALAFSASGATLAAGGTDGTITLWDVQARRARPPLRGHDGSVTALAYGAGERILASGGDDGTVRLWDVPNSFAISLPGPRDERVAAVALAADGRTVASAEQDGSVRTWDLSLRTRVAKACALAGGNLSQAEWDRWISSGTPYERTCARFRAGTGAPAAAPAAPLP
jgi:WD40 repeat protein